jgi:hypothetical protein
MTIIQLTPSEIMQGALIGIMRQMQNIRDKRQHAYGTNDGQAWQVNIEGAIGELALAKHLGVYYAGTGIFRGTDVGKYDVRTTQYENGHLILHPDDPDDRIFWLLTGVCGRYIIRGNILGKDGKQEKWWGDKAGGRAAFFIPQDALNLSDV